MIEEQICYTFSTQNGYNLIIIKDLTKVEFEKYCSYISCFSKLEHDENLYKLVELNYGDLSRTLTDFVDKVDSKNARMNDFRTLFIDANRLVLNFLSSIRTYLDHTETRIKREYGEDSEDYQLFKAETEYAYDNNFSYRFLYKLRNYAQHCGLPSGFIQHNSSAGDEGNTSNKVNVFLVRDELINHYDSWSPQLKIEILSQPEKFDIVPLLNNMSLILSDINNKIIKLTYLRYVNEASELINLLKQAKNFEGQPCLILHKGKSENLKLTIQWFPIEIILKTVHYLPDPFEAG